MSVGFDPPPLLLCSWVIVHIASCVRTTCNRGARPVNTTTRCLMSRNLNHNIGPAMCDG